MKVLDKTFMCCSVGAASHFSYIKGVWDNGHKINKIKNEN